MDRTIEGFEGLEAAQEAIKEEDKRDKFAADFKYLAKLGNRYLQTTYSTCIKQTLSG